MFGLSIFNGWNSYAGKNANLDRMTLGPRLQVNEEGNDIFTRLQNEISIRLVVSYLNCILKKNQIPTKFWNIINIVKEYFVMDIY